jgi:hypothetical protein
VIKTDVRIVVEAFFTSSDLTIVEKAERDARDLACIIWIFVV